MSINGRVIGCSLVRFHNCRNFDQVSRLCENWGLSSKCQPKVHGKLSKNITFAFFFCTFSSPSLISSTSWGAHGSYVPLAFTASLRSRIPLPEAYSEGSMILLNGPFRGRLAMRINLPFSSRLSTDLRLLDPAAVTREKTAGTADRWARILADVSWDAKNLGGRALRTSRWQDACQSMQGFEQKNLDALRSSPLVSIWKSWSSSILFKVVLHSKIMALHQYSWKRNTIESITYPTTLSSALMPSNTSSTSSILIFFLQARFPFRLDWLCCEGAPTTDRVGFLPFTSDSFFALVVLVVFVAIADWQGFLGSRWSSLKMHHQIWVSRLEITKPKVKGRNMYGLLAQGLARMLCIKASAWGRGFKSHRVHFFFLFFLNTVVNIWTLSALANPTVLQAAGWKMTPN